ncbi:MAG: siphovirus Gp157 family protein [Bacteroidia bacterium]|nr:siphovirus Gp157 family protein [Bacteroidia bacterium]
MYQNIWNLVENEDIDLDNLEMALKTIEDSLESKAEGIAKIIKSIESDAAVLKEEETRLASRRKALENKKENIKSYLKEQLSLAGIDKVKTPLMTIALQNNPPSVNVIEEDKIPKQYKVKTVSISLARREMLEALKAGAVIPGVEIKQDKSLRIR